MSEIKCGIQLYTVRSLCQTLEDTDRVLARLQTAGVHDIQVSGIGEMDWGRLSEIIKNHNMEVCVTHVPFDRIINDTDSVIEDHVKLGCDCIGIGCFPSEYERTEEGSKQFIKDILPAAKKINGRNMHLTYHNHDFDVKPNGGKSILDGLIEDVPEELLWFVPDVAWLQIAGENPSEYLKRMVNRVKVIHFKDYFTDKDSGSHRFTELGKGLVNLDKCYETAQQMNIPYIMFEQDDNWTTDPVTSCIESFEYMKEIQLRH
ncbi:MAG: sugar phosphate isomerase/epimerase [Clostridiales bacterium]|nr:sugar phosphate isomerase/epimerase [Clostridiales bacterium]